MRRSLGCAGKLVAKDDGHLEYIAEFAWHVGKLVAGESLLSMIWLLLTI
ncbi:hypothetical protein [Paenibacillus sp. FSL L8-0494]